eukprot:Tbor_TRINITY_DN5184_c2_g7::TRINITY_DN5184_c2_g7_i1::g.25851::m.25851
MTLVPVKGRTSMSFILDISPEAVGKFGFSFDDRVSTPKGPAFVIGTRTIKGIDRLYFRLEDEEFASFWSSCETKEDFQAKGFKIINHSNELCNSSGNMHRIKKIEFNNDVKTIVMQLENGPCPIIALANSLSLQGLFSPDTNIRPTAKYVSSAQLRKDIATYLKKRNPTPKFTGPSEVRNVKTLRGIIESNATTADSFTEEKLAGMYKGLNISPYFDTVDGFEGEADLCFFGLAGVRLFHIWIIPDNEEEPFRNIRDSSWTEVNIVATGESDESFLAREFITSPQATSFGLKQLEQEMIEGEVGALFMNNHFSTITKKDGVILQLVTDEGYSDKNCIVFQKLSLTGDSLFFDGDGKVVEEIVLRAMVEHGNLYSRQEILVMERELKAIKASMNYPNPPTLEEVVKALEAKVLKGSSSVQVAIDDNSTNPVQSSRASSRSCNNEIDESHSNLPNTAVSKKIILDLIAMGFEPHACEKVVSEKKPRDAAEAVAFLV